MSFKIIVTETRPPEGDSKYPQQTAIYEQLVDTLDIIKVIDAVNGRTK